MRTWLAAPFLMIGSIAVLPFVACGPPEEAADAIPQQELVETAPMSSMSPRDTAIPESFPPAVPIYANAEVVQSHDISRGERGGAALLLLTDDDIIQVRDFYITQLETDDWSISNRAERENRILLIFRRAGDTVSIAIGLDEAGRTNILIEARETLVSH